MNRGKGKTVLALLAGLAATAAACLLLSNPNARAVTPEGGQTANRSGIAASSELTCPGRTTLEELVACIVGQMPGGGSEGFVVPAGAVQDDWRDVVGRMLGGQCTGITLPISLSGVYTITAFVDADDGQGYCVLMEILDGDGDDVVDRGWGTFIVNSSPTRELSIQVAHPIYDMDTAAQGVGVFKGTGSRSFLMAGTHRHANFVCSTCQHPDCQPGEVVTESERFLEADVAHDVENLFQPAVEELLAFYDGLGVDFTALQFHGMGSTSCPGVDVYLTCGLSTPPAAGEKVLDLKDNLAGRNPTWTVTVPGDPPSCGLHGSTNVQGRLLNGVAPGDVCTTYAAGCSGLFIHAEQKLHCRDAGAWIGAINDTWPVYFGYLPLVARNSPTPD